MPLFDYRCFFCDRVDEVFKPLEQIDEVNICGVCGEKMKRLPSKVSISFKGSGFYCNDKKGVG